MCPPGLPASPPPSLPSCNCSPGCTKSNLQAGKETNSSHPLCRRLPLLHASEAGPVLALGRSPGAWCPSWLPGPWGGLLLCLRGLPGHSGASQPWPRAARVRVGPNCTQPALGGRHSPASPAATLSRQCQRGRALLRPSDAGVCERPSDREGAHGPRHPPPGKPDRLVGANPKRK